MSAPRSRMPSERDAVTHRFELGGHKLYLTVGLFPAADGQPPRPGEVFIRAAGTDSMERGLLNAVGILASMALQSGVPLEDIAQKFIGTRFEPDGWIGGRHYKSVLDYIFRWIADRFPQNSEINTGLIQTPEARS